MQKKKVILIGIILSLCFVFFTPFGKSLTGLSVLKPDSIRFQQLNSVMNYIETNHGETSGIITDDMTWIEVDRSDPELVGCAWFLYESGNWRVRFHSCTVAPEYYQINVNATYQSYGELPCIDCPLQPYVNWQGYIKTGVIHEESCIAENLDSAPVIEDDSLQWYDSPLLFGNSMRSYMIFLAIMLVSVLLVV